MRLHALLRAGAVRQQLLRAHSLQDRFGARLAGLALRVSYTRRLQALMRSRHLACFVGFDTVREILDSASQSFPNCSSSCNVCRQQRPSLPLFECTRARQNRSKRDTT